MCEKPTLGSEDVAIGILQREMSNIHDQHDSFDGPGSLAAFQAYLVYSMVLYFHLGQSRSPFLREAMVNLQNLACATSRRGLMCSAEAEHVRPRWNAWVLMEAKRRTLYTMYLFDGVLSAQDGLPTALGTELSGLPAPSSKQLWQAQAREEWEKAYNAHLADLAQSLRIEELWPIPEGLDAAGRDARRRRIDIWLQHVDDLDRAHCPRKQVQSAMRNTVELPMDTPEISSRECPRPPNSNPPFSIFDYRQKALIVCIVSTAASFSGFASNIYFPTIPSIARDLDVSVESVNLTVTSYLIFQGLAPSLWGPISDAKGRRAAYFGTFIVLFGACSGLALSKNYASLVVLRCLQSTGSACTIAIGAGVIGDITTRAERGAFMGVFQAGMLAPVALGPVIGGALTGSLGWRSVFWFLTISSGAFLLLLVFLLPETLRAMVGNGSHVPSSLAIRFPLCVYQKTSKAFNGRGIDSDLQPKEAIDMSGPFRILFSKHAFPIIAFLAIYYAVWQMSITAMSSLFEGSYGLGDGQIGLTFIANGVGSIMGTLHTGKMLNTDYRRLHEAYEANRVMRSTTNIIEDFPLEKARLRLLPVFASLQCVSILAFGWTINYPHHIHIAVPIISTFFTGWAAVSTQSAVTTYMVDVFSEHSAAASASLNLARCLLAAGATSFVMPMINGIGCNGDGQVCGESKPKDCKKLIEDARSEACSHTRSMT
ncbi:lysine-specific permease [Stagonosporopsis vannaccii]|nr:lysine-specific permease [Stagonosporopsis vannaccii]